MVDPSQPHRGSWFRVESPSPTFSQTHLSSIKWDQYRVKHSTKLSTQGKRESSWPHTEIVGEVLDINKHINC